MKTPVEEKLERLKEELAERERARGRAWNEYEMAAQIAERDTAAREKRVNGETGHQEETQEAGKAGEGIAAVGLVCLVLGGIALVAALVLGKPEIGYVAGGCVFWGILFNIWAELRKIREKLKN